MTRPVASRRPRWAFLAALLGLAACVPAQQTTRTLPPQPAVPVAAPPDGAGPIPSGRPQIGLLVPLSGRGSEIGRDMLDAAQLALFDVGETEVVLLPRDTGDTPDTAATAAQDALGEGAELLLGPLFANATRTVGPLAAAADRKVLSFSNDASVASSNVWALGFRPEEQVERVIRFAHAQGLRNLALLAPSDAYGVLASRTFERVTGELGVVGRALLYPPGGDASEEARRLAAEAPRPDAVVVAEGGARLGRVAALLQPALPGGRLLGTRRWQEDPAALAEPTLVGGWIAGVAPAAETAFRDRFRSAYGRNPHELAALAYDATALGVLLARSDRTYPREMLTDPQGFVGTLSSFRLREDGLAQHGLAILEVRPEGLSVVDPAPQDFVAGAAGF